MFIKVASPVNGGGNVFRSCGSTVITKRYLISLGSKVVA